MPGLIASISYPPIPLFELGPLTLSLHGLFAGLGFIAGSALILRRVGLRRFDQEGMTSALTWGLVGALIGARLFTIPAHIGDPGFGFSDAVSLAGFYSIMGGFAGGIIGGGIRMRTRKMPFLTYMDFGAFGLALGTVVGRIGDLLIVEHLGGKTDFFLGYLVKPGYDLAPQHDQLETLCEIAAECGPYHHAGLYDLVGAALLLGALYVAARRIPLRYGQLFAMWGGWYGIQRFLIDFTRNTDLPDADRTLGALTWSQWSGLVVGLLFIGFFFWLRKRGTPITAENDLARGATAPAAGTAAADDGEEAAVDTAGLKVAGETTDEGAAEEDEV